MRFSRRTEWDTEETDLARAHRARLAAGEPVADLTASNPTRCGFLYPLELLDPLSQPAALDYDPNPKGSLTARQAICSYYAAHGAGPTPGQILLTTSTSEAYSYIFKLLCNPGDALLAPQPSYPLFDFLARVESVELMAAPLVYDHGWQLDLASLDSRISERTRGIVLVHPNNPTGHFTKVWEARELAALCRRRNVALIVDEVFLDYPLDEPATLPLQDRSTFVARELDVLTFVVSGISKICGLPQMKAAWIAASGPGWQEAMARIEIIADTFLSMNAPVQHALPVWMEGRHAIQNAIRGRVAANLAVLDSLLAAQRDEAGGTLASRLRVEGGWYAIVRVPALQSDERTAMELLERGLWLHPGCFFGLPSQGWLVVSLLTLPQEFASGMECLLGYVQEKHLGFL